MRLAIAVFVFAQALLSVAALLLDQTGSPVRGYLFNGIVAGQAALLGIWLGIGGGGLAQRMATTIAGVVALTVPAALHQSFSGWEFLLILVRVAFLGAVFTWIRRRRGLVLSNSGLLRDITFGQITLKQLFGLVTGVALYLAVGRVVESVPSPVYPLMLVVFVVMFGVASALVPLVAALGALASRHRAKMAVIALVVILLLATAIAGFAYSQTNSWETAGRWLVGALIEALVVAASLLALRRLGYRLTPGPEPASD